MFRNISNLYWKEDVLASFHLDKGTKTELKIGKSKKDIQVSSLIDNFEFEDNFAQCATFSKLTNSQSVSLRKRIVEILDIIQQELK